MNNKSKSEPKQFHELTDAEKAELEQSQRDRAKAEGRELLQDVVCAYRPSLNVSKCADCGGKMVKNGEEWHNPSCVWDIK